MSRMRLQRLLVKVTTVRQLNDDCLTFSPAPVLIYRQNSFSSVRWRPFYFVNFESPFGQRLRRIAARLRATAIKNVNANSVLHMSPSPHCRRHNGFLFCDFFWFVAGGIP